MSSPRMETSKNIDDLLKDFVSDSEIDESLVNISLDNDSNVPNQELWSKGQCFLDKNGKEIEPVRVFRPNVDNRLQDTHFIKATSCNRKRKQGKENSQGNVSNGISKKSKKCFKIGGQSMLTSFLQSPSSYETFCSAKDISFSLSQLQHLVARSRSEVVTTDDVYRSEVVTTDDDNIYLIKRLDPWGVWLVHKNRKIYVLNPYRIQESLLYRQLLSTYIATREKLPRPIVLNEVILGNKNRLSLLKKLVTKNNLDKSIRITCDDKRLVSNGFEISGKFDSVKKDFVISVDQMNVTIPYFGITDLIEILDLIKENDNVVEKQDLCKFRPSKILTLLKEESARISRSLPSRMSNADLNKLLKNMKENLENEENYCVHNQPLLYPLMSF
ncbi:PMS1 protein homolog 1-like [Xenia sp. Carnegie-2017]|uniref:PMS1 protein homolog 1-like n=1 Tax=Xenia sp. Carnegie-2017 TaxID=2897299 RepID=UPI001F03B383|nr:PMS1 protein homolog 1-like [Xenia sp. Carnegie-2017]